MADTGLDLDALMDALDEGTPPIPPAVDVQPAEVADAKDPVEETPTVPAPVPEGAPSVSGPADVPLGTEVPAWYTPPAGPLGPEVPPWMEEEYAGEGPEEGWVPSKGGWSVYNENILNNPNALSVVKQDVGLADSLLSVQTQSEIDSLKPLFQSFYSQVYGGSALQDSDGQATPMGSFLSSYMDLLWGRGHVYHPDWTPEGQTVQQPVPRGTTGRTGKWERAIRPWDWFDAEIGEVSAGKKKAQAAEMLSYINDGNMMSAGHVGSGSEVQSWYSDKQSDRFYTFAFWLEEMDRRLTHDNKTALSEYEDIMKMTERGVEPSGGRGQVDELRSNYERNYAALSSFNLLKKAFIRYFKTPETIGINIRARVRGEPMGHDYDSADAKSSFRSSEEPSNFTGVLEGDSYTLYPVFKAPKTPGRFPNYEGRILPAGVMSGGGGPGGLYLSRWGIDGAPKFVADQYMEGRKAQVGAALQDFYGEQSGFDEFARINEIGNKIVGSLLKAQPEFHDVALDDYRRSLGILGSSAALGHSLSFDRRALGSDGELRRYGAYRTPELGMYGAADAEDVAVGDYTYIGEPWEADVDAILPEIMNLTVTEATVLVRGIRAVAQSWENQGARRRLNIDGQPNAQKEINKMFQNAYLWDSATLTHIADIIELERMNHVRLGHVQY